MLSTGLGTKNIEVNTVSNILHGAFLPVMGEKYKEYILCKMMINPKENNKVGKGKRQLHEHTDIHTHSHSGLTEVKE